MPNKKAPKRLSKTTYAADASQDPAPEPQWDDPHQPYHYLRHALACTAACIPTFFDFSSSGTLIPPDSPNTPISPLMQHFNSLIRAIQAAKPGDDIQAAEWRNDHLTQLQALVMAEASRTTRKQKEEMDEIFHGEIDVAELLESVKAWHPGPTRTAEELEQADLSRHLPDPRPFHTHHGMNRFCHDMTCSWDDRYPLFAASKGFGYGYRFKKDEKEEVVSFDEVYDEGDSQGRQGRQGAKNATRKTVVNAKGKGKAKRK